MMESVLSLLREESIEDGVMHSADKYIAEELEKGKGLAEIYSWCYNNLDSVKLPVSSVLRCVGRLEKKAAGEDGKLLMLNALRNQNLEVRETAVRAFEKWGGKDSMDILLKYKSEEEVVWLREYAEQVISDLS